MSEPLHDPPPVEAAGAPRGPLAAAAHSTARLLWLALAGLVLARVAMACAGQHWALELSTHFAFQYGLLALVVMAGFACLARPLGVGLAAVVFALHSGPLLELTGSSPERAASTPDVTRLLMANVRTSNANRRGLLELVESTQPDAVLLLEVSEAWLADLAPLDGDYPHRLAEPRGDNFGIALYSRRPLTDGRIVQLGAAGLPSIEAALEGSGLRLLLTHPLPPMGSGAAAQRDRQLEAVARRARELGPRVVLAGDLNATPWSPVFSRVLDLGALRDSRDGFGLQPTWSAGLPDLARIPIDHFLVGRDVRVLHREVGPRIGSDHLPVLVELR